MHQGTVATVYPGNQHWYWMPLLLGMVPISIYIWLFERKWEEMKSEVNKLKKVEGKTKCPAPNILIIWREIDKLSYSESNVFPIAFHVEDGERPSQSYSI